MAFISYKEEQRYNSIDEAMRKWDKLTLPCSKPTVIAIRLLSGLSRVQSYELKKIKEGGNN